MIKLKSIFNLKLARIAWSRENRIFIFKPSLMFISGFEWIKFVHALWWGIKSAKCGASYYWLRFAAPQMPKCAPTSAAAPVGEFTVITADLQKYQKIYRLERKFCICKIMNLKTRIKWTEHSPDLLRTVFKKKL